MQRILQERVVEDCALRFVARPEDAVPTKDLLEIFEAFDAREDLDVSADLAYATWQQTAMKSLPCDMAIRRSVWRRLGKIM